MLNRGNKNTATRGNQKVKLLILKRAFWLESVGSPSSLNKPFLSSSVPSVIPVFFPPFRWALFFHQDLVGGDTSLTLAVGPQRVKFNPHVLGLKNLGYLG